MEYIYIFISITSILSSIVCGCYLFYNQINFNLLLCVKTQKEQTTVITVHRHSRNIKYTKMYTKTSASWKIKNIPYIYPPYLLQYSGNLAMLFAYTETTEKRTTQQTRM